MASSSTPTIPRRRVDLSFDPNEVPRYWYANEKALTMFWNAFSLLLPEGERFFVDSVRHYRSSIDDAELLAAVNGFVAQESMHGKEHDGLNAMIAAQGFASAKPIETNLKKLLDFGRKFPAEHRLAITCALEHFTAMIGEQLLRDEWHQENIDVRVRDLWRWHALEESEHKSVAYDVYVHAKGGYLVRVSWMVIASVILAFVMAGAQLALVRDDRQLTNLRSWFTSFDTIWGRRGLFRVLAFEYLDYFRPGFHPSQRDSSPLIASWREKLFGDEGSFTVRSRATSHGAATAAA